MFRDSIQQDCCLYRTDDATLKACPAGSATCSLKVLHGPKCCNTYDKSNSLCPVGDIEAPNYMKDGVNPKNGCNFRFPNGEICCSVRDTTGAPCTQTADNKGSCMARNQEGKVCSPLLDAKGVECVFGGPGCDYQDLAQPGKSSCAYRTKGPPPTPCTGGGADVNCMLTSSEGAPCCMVATKSGPTATCNADNHVKQDNPGCIWRQMDGEPCCSLRTAQGAVCTDPTVSGCMWRNQLGRVT